MVKYWQFHMVQPNRISRLNIKSLTFKSYGMGQTGEVEERAEEITWKKSTESK